jgi:2-oxoisovalerate dehydrogenase E1 component
MTMSTTHSLLEELLSLSFKEAKEKYLHILKVMVASRFIDEKALKLVKQNKGGTFHMHTAGHEMIGAVSALSLIPGKDWGFPYYRDRAFALGLGCDKKELLAGFLARVTPHHSGGRMMPDHYCHKELRIPCQSSVVGSQFLQAVGVAKAARLAGKNEVVYVSGGDGSTSQGDFHEALNYACIHRLSVLFVIQDNGWAISVPSREQTAGASIAKVGRGYEGLSVFDIDGCDFLQVSKALREAVKKGRALEGPSLIVAKVPRLGPHSNSDDPKKYRKKEEEENAKLRDPILLYEKWLIEKKFTTPDEIQILQEDLRQEIEVAAREAEKLPFPHPDTVSHHLFKKHDFPLLKKEEKRGPSIVMVDAINHALDEEMERDEGVIVFGQDVARGKGGVFGVTRGLTAKYGEDRCFNTPLAESTIIGTAIGMSVHSNFVPIVEVQFSDYLWTGINQIFNELASYHYRSNGEWHCPVVIRTTYGGYVQGGPYHSQSVEGFLCHCPGLKVVVPSNAADAKMLLKSAIRDPNPVLFLEPKILYREPLFCVRNEPLSEELLPLGKANIVREGHDVTVVCWGMMVSMVSSVTSILEKDGIDVEVIDLRTLQPLDLQTILQSVEKTGKLLIVHEAPQTCGFGAEIAARIVEKGFDCLDAPPLRLGGVDVCVPYAKDLEERVLPQKNGIEKAIRELANY